MTPAASARRTFGTSLHLGLSRAWGWVRPSTTTGFVLSTLLAVAISLYVAYALELASPSSAATTVLIVSSSSRGAILSKSFWRVAGSIVGAIAAVTLVALFAQSPVLFVFGLALWLGVCTFVSSLLRYFRSYGAVLAGYTVVLVALGALANPDTVFLTAAARVAVVTVGVLSSSLVSMVLDIGTQRPVIAATLANLIADTARLLVESAGAQGRSLLPISRRRLATELVSLDQTVEYAAVEDAGFGRFASDLRSASAELFAALTGGPRAILLLSRVAAQGDAALLGLSSELNALLGRIAEPDITLARAETLLHALAAMRAQLWAHHAHDVDLTAISALEQASVLTTQLTVAIEAMVGLQRGVPRPRHAPLKIYQNPNTAMRNGVRAALAVTIGGLFWIYSQWSSGATLLVALGPITALLAQSESAAAASVGFLKGMVLAVIGAFICTFALMPMVSGFPLLLAVMFPFLAAGLICSTKPTLAPVAIPFLIFFVGLSSPDNPMRYDLAAFLNSGFAFVLGAACGVLTFRVLLPPNPEAEAAYLANAIRADVLRLLRRQLPDKLAWEHLQHQKMVRLGRRLAGNPAARNAAIDQAGGIILIGRRLQLLRQFSTDGSLPPNVSSRVADVLSAIRSTRTRAAGAGIAEVAAVDISAEGAATPFLPRAVRRTAAALHDLASLLVLHGPYLCGETGPDVSR